MASTEPLSPNEIEDLALTAHELTLLCEDRDVLPGLVEAVAALRAAVAAEEMRYAPSACAREA